MVQDIVKEVMAKLQLQSSAPAAQHGVFGDMNEAIEAAKKAQVEIHKMSMDQREQIISNIRKKTKENAELFARMGVEETGMGNVPHKILKHILVAEKTPGTEDITTTAWAGDRGLTLIEMGPFGVIGAITPTTNPSETIICNTIGMVAGGNTVVFNPHPAAIKTSLYAINMINEASLEAGGPDNIACSVTKPTLAYTPYKVTRYKSIYNEKDSNIGIATGRYVDIAGDRYIEIYTVPDPNLSAAVISREQLIKLKANDPLNKGKEGEARRELMMSMINCVGYDKNKYILTYTIPATAFVRLSSIVLVDSNNNTFDKGDIEKDSSTIINNNKKSNGLLLLASMILLGD